MHALLPPGQGREAGCPGGSPFEGCEGPGSRSPPMQRSRDGSPQSSLSHAHQHYLRKALRTQRALLVECIAGIPPGTCITCNSLNVHVQQYQQLKTSCLQRRCMKMLSSRVGRRQATGYSWDVLKGRTVRTQRSPAPMGDLPSCCTARGTVKLCFAHAMCKNPKSLSSAPYGIYPAAKENRHKSGKPCWQASDKG